MVHWPPSRSTHLGRFDTRPAACATASQPKSLIATTHRYATLALLLAGSIPAEISIYGWLDAWCLGWARFDWDGGPVWGWDGLINGERSFLRLLPDHDAAVVLMTNSGTGRAMYRPLFPDLMQALFAIRVPPLRLDPSHGVTDGLSRFAGVYAWPDRRLQVTESASALIISGDEMEAEALRLDVQSFLVDADDPDNPAVTFGAFDAHGRPQVLYTMLWGLPRLDRLEGVNPAEGALRRARPG